MIIYVPLVVYHNSNTQQVQSRLLSLFGEPMLLPSDLAKHTLKTYYSFESLKYYVLLPYFIIFPALFKKYMCLSFDTCFFFGSVMGRQSKRTLMGVFPVKHFGVK